MTDTEPHAVQPVKEQSVAVRAARGGDIKAALEASVDAIGHSRLITLDNGGWYDSFGWLSHSVRNEMMPQFRTPEEYLSVESDLLHFRPVGYNAPNPGPIEADTPNRVKSLMLMVATFTQMRQALSKNGLTLPDNPVMQKAIDVLRFQTAKDVRMQSALEQFMDKKEVLALSSGSVPDSPDAMHR